MSVPARPCAISPFPRAAGEGWEGGRTPTSHPHPIPPPQTGEGASASQ
jgi:hypothetical protein